MHYRKVRKSHTIFQKVGNLSCRHDVEVAFFVHIFCIILNNLEWSEDLVDYRDILFGLRELPGIGEKTINRLYAREDVLKHIFEMELADFLSLGIDKRRAAIIRGKLNSSFIAERKECYERAGIQIIVRGDERYPEMLDQITYPPTVLYVKGDVGLLAHPSLAVVGTRRATTYGKRATRRIVAELASFGFGIVSGLARGIDTEAHRTSLEQQVPTIAVLGTGLDIIYPRENRLLYERIAEQGVLVSENPLGRKIHQGLFYLRNRIIAGLALGVVVIEADENSGALITASYADGEHRDVYAVPGSIFSPQSRGTLFWIGTNRAKCISSGIEIADEYPHVMKELQSGSLTGSKGGSGAEKPGGFQAGRVAPKLTKDEQFILSCLAEGEATIDELLQKTNFAFGHLHTVLLSLLIKKQIQKRTGSTYVSTH